MVSVSAEERAQLQRYAVQTNVRPSVETLRASRDEILSRWLEAVRSQPFHLGRPARAVSDHIPTLFDALVAALAEAAADTNLLGDGRAVEAARNHAQARVAQGLLPGEIVVEFRLLREEILHALHEHGSDDQPAADAFGAQLLLGAGLDAAIGQAIDYFMTALEQSKDDFIAIVAHDLRGPLTTLKGMAQLLQRQAAADRMDKQDLQHKTGLMVDSAARMEQLLRNLLDVTRVQTSRLDLRAESTDLQELVHRVVRRQSEEARQRTEIVSDGSPLTGTWEASRIEQVVENLLGNALKYAPTGPIRIRLATVGVNARLEVTDAGVGLSSEDRALLFRRFYRAPEMVERKIEGIGLGLYICRGIVEAHGGEVAAHSAGRGHGTTMTVLLPLAGPLTRSSDDSGAAD